MEKFQVATKADLKEAAIIEHRRRYEEERKARIFNTRNRIFGVRIQWVDWVLWFFHSWSITG